MADEIMKEAYQEAGLDAQEVERRLTALLASPGGMNKVAASMLSPLKRDLLYEGRIRQLFQTYKLALGEEAVFDADVAVPATALAVNGLPYQTQVVSDRVRIDTAPLSTKPIVRWNESNFRKFDVLNRTQERAKASLQLQEDSKGYTLIKYAASVSNQPDIPGLENTTASSANPSTASISGGRLTIDALATGVVTLRSKLLNASKIFMNPLRGKDLILFNTSNAATGGYGIFAPNYQEAALKAGKVGNSMGCEVIDSVVVPSSEVYVLPPADYLGVIAVRTDVSVETMKDVNQMADVFAIWEDIGFCCRFVKGIYLITVNA